MKSGLGYIMIYLRIPNNGLGNQMFSYAYGRFLSEKSHDNIVLDYSDSYKSGQDHNDEFKTILNKFNLRYAEVLFTKRNLIKRVGGKAIKFFALRKISNLISGDDTWLCKKENDNVKKYIKQGLYLNDDASFYQKDYLIYEHTQDIMVHGLWQNIIYIDSIKNILKEEFCFDKVLTPSLNEIIYHIDSKSVCVHCRRGDYIGHSLLNLCSKEYFIKAIEWYTRKYSCDVLTFYIFSDDIDWVRNNIVFPGKSVFITGNLSIQDMAIMTYFSNYIISNSTFSFWGQYLSKYDNKNVVAPKQWFKHNKRCHLYEDNWITI